MNYRTLANSHIAFVLLGDLFYRGVPSIKISTRQLVEKHLRSFDYLTQVVSLRLCKRNGHALVDDSQAGQESGSVACYCRRCGWNVRSILY